MTESLDLNDGLHAKLREATKNLHRRLDHHPVLAPLVQPSLDQRHYGNALLALYGVHAPLEDAIAAFFNQHPGVFDYASRSKTAALKADLAQLGRTPPPITGPAHAIGSLAESVGVMYPLEGSMLGAQVILRQLQTGSCDPLPTRFFPATAIRRMYVGAVFSLGPTPIVLPHNTTLPLPLRSRYSPPLPITLTTWHST